MDDKSEAATCRKVNARDIQRALIRKRWLRSICCPNYTPTKWFECDVFELTKAGFFREYEIKLTTSDFRADAKKAQRRWNGEITEGRKFLYDERNKHEALKGRDARGPSKFWFVAPEGVIPANELPEWAGHILVTPRLNLVETKPAPQLHRAKIDEKLRTDVHTTAYWRFMRMFLDERKAGGAQTDFPATELDM